MGLEKAIKAGKEHRKEYHDSRSFDYSCRNHGTCEWCKGNRLYNDKKRRQQALDKLRDYETEEMFEED